MNVIKTKIEKSLVLWEQESDGCLDWAVNNITEVKKGDFAKLEKIRRNEPAACY